MTNRKLGIILMLVGSFLMLTSSITLLNIYDDEPTYCDGWDEGYEQGWCYERVNCISPPAPVCPVAEVGQDTYKDGYNRGFTKGKKDRE